MRRRCTENMREGDEGRHVLPCVHPIAVRVPFRVQERKIMVRMSSRAEDPVPPRHHGEFRDDFFFWSFCLSGNQGGIVGERKSEDIHEPRCRRRHLPWGSCAVRHRQGDEYIWRRRSTARRSLRDEHGQIKPDVRNRQKKAIDDNCTPRPHGRVANPGAVRRTPASTSEGEQGHEVYGLTRADGALEESLRSRDQGHGRKPSRNPVPPDARGGLRCRVSKYNPWTRKNRLLTARRRDLCPMFSCNLRPAERICALDGSFHRYDRMDADGIVGSVAANIVISVRTQPRSTMRPGCLR